LFEKRLTKLYAIFINSYKTVGYESIKQKIRCVLQWNCIANNETINKIGCNLHFTVVFKDT